jgi:2-hydroxychromene-2-carboxylate isomerase
MPGLKPTAIQLFLDHGPRVRNLLHSARGALSSEARAIEFYWSAACPYSFVVAQQLIRLTEGSDVCVRVRPMPMGAPEVSPCSELRERLGPKECASLTDFYDIEFPGKWVLPSDESTALGNRIVAGSPSLEACVEVGRALWTGESSRLQDALGKYGEVSAAEAQELLEGNARRQRSKGHYQPGTVCYFGEWFEGPMRMEILAQRMASKGHPKQAPWSSRTIVPVKVDAPSFEMWFSFRSPYAYLAAARIQRWREAGETFQITFRPVLPMVMRGLPVPSAKKMYIVKDAVREARRLGIPFGHIADPVGAGAERCLAVCAAVTNQDGNTERSFDFAVVASKGIWSEGIDVASDEGLLTLAERSGISRDEVMSALADLPAGGKLAEFSRERMTEAGVWGVPCFRAGDFVTWGQDRLPFLRHVLGLPLK